MERGGFSEESVSLMLFDNANLFWDLLFGGLRLLDVTCRY